MAMQPVPLTRSDRDLVADVQHAIDIDRSIPGGVHARSVNGTITLSGRVHRVAQRVAAEVAARTIDGVGTIVNRIEVQPDHIEPPDDCC